MILDSDEDDAPPWNGMDNNWSAESATTTLIAALQKVPVSLIRTPRLIRVGTNAVYELHTRDDQALGRVSPSDYEPELLKQQMEFAGWLHSQGFPTSAPLIPEIIWVGGRGTTLWEWITPDEGADIDFYALGELLARLHSVTDMYRGSLPNWEPLGRLGDRLSAVEIDDAFGKDDRQVLCDWRDKLLADVKALSFDRPAGPIHGDVHTGNVILSGGQLYIVDLDRIARGPREWDLTQILVANARFGTPANKLDAFMAGYGWDIRQHPGAELLQQLRALFMTSWLLTLPRTDAVQAEIKNRLTYWRNPDAEAPLWHPV